MEQNLKRTILEVAATKNPEKKRKKELSENQAPTTRVA